MIVYNTGIYIRDLLEVAGIISLQSLVSKCVPANKVMHLDTNYNEIDAPLSTHIYSQTTY